MYVMYDDIKCKCVSDLKITVKFSSIFMQKRIEILDLKIYVKALLVA